MNVYSEFSSDTDYTSILYDKGKCIPLVINVLEEVSIAPNIPILGEKTTVQNEDICHFNEKQTSSSHEMEARIWVVEK